MQAQHRTRDDAKRAFRADEQVLKVVAGVVLQHLIEATDHSAIGENRLQAQNLVAEHAVTNDAISSGVCGDVATDLAGAARAQVHSQE